MREAHLRDLVAVFETGSVRAAARKLGLSPSAVSKNLSALERSIGVPLLVRSANGIEPTEFGRVILKRARIVDSELRKLREELDDLSGIQQHACVTVGLSATAEVVLLPEAIAQFRERTPGVMVSLFGGRSSSSIAGLRDAKIDFAVGPALQGKAPSDLRLERLCSSELGIVVRSGHPAAACSDLAPLAGYGWIVAVRQADGETTVTSLFRERGLPDPTLVAHSDSNSGLLSMLLQTDLVSLTSLAAIEPYRRQGMLAVLPIDLKLPPVVQHLITSAARPLTPAAASLATEFRKASRRLRR
jgi:DNA-binding transcriptional LysR family regulator